MSQERISQLYKRYGPLLFSRCKRILGDGHLAADAVQEAFVRLFPYFERSDETQIQALALRIATNVCLDWMRKRTWETPVELLPEREGSDLAEQLLQRDYLFHLLRRAPEKLREPALLHHFDGLSQEKIANVLSISPRTVFTRLREFEAFVKEEQLRTRAEAEA